jgi:alpha-D-ribose 1-methylphosphonate 5-phosphate C-P lyase
MIDQGDDASVNAANLRRLVERTTGLRTTFETSEATIVQSRHRIPEERLRADQTLVLQCPNPEPLRSVEPSMAIARRMHAEGDYSRMWVSIYEGVVRRGELTGAAGYPVLVNNRYVMAPTPIPRWDVPKMDNAEYLCLIGAGREKRLYAVPPYTSVKPLEFEDYRFQVEDFSERRCARCGTSGREAFLDEATDEEGRTSYSCNDRSFCDRVRAGEAVVRW